MSCTKFRPNIFPLKAANQVRPHNIRELIHPGRPETNNETTRYIVFEHPTKKKNAKGRLDESIWLKAAADVKAAFAKIMHFITNFHLPASKHD